MAIVSLFVLLLPSPSPATAGGAGIEIPNFVCAALGNTGDAADTWEAATPWIAAPCESLDAEDTEDWWVSYPPHGAAKGYEVHACPHGNLDVRLSLGVAELLSRDPPAMRTVDAAGPGECEVLAHHVGLFDRFYISVSHVSGAGRYDLLVLGII